MKKLLIATLVIAITNLVLLTLMFNHIKRFDVEAPYATKDTAINHFRIDSISLVIHEKDSVINNIIIEKNEAINESNSLSDSASYELFLELLSN